MRRWGTRTSNRGRIVKIEWFPCFLPRQNMPTAAPCYPAPRSCRRAVRPPWYVKPRINGFYTTHVVLWTNCYDSLPTKLVGVSHPWHSMVQQWSSLMARGSRPSNRSGSPRSPSSRSREAPTQRVGNRTPAQPWILLGGSVASLLGSTSLMRQHLRLSLC